LGVDHLSVEQHAFPWNVRSAPASPDEASGALVFSVALLLGLSSALGYEWMLLHWQRKWVSRARAQPMFLYGWPFAMFALAALASFDSMSQIPLRWILAPLYGAMLVWLALASDFKITLRQLLPLAINCIAFGSWPWSTIVGKDFVLAMLIGINTFCLLTGGRLVVALVIERYSAKRAAWFWRFGWFAPLAVLIWLALMGEIAASHHAAWLFGCWFFTLWGMLTTPFHTERCMGCLTYGLMGAFALAFVLVPEGAERVGEIWSVALAFLVGAYFIVEVFRRARAVK
jgi:hypothetical protein